MLRMVQINNLKEFNSKRRRLIIRFVILSVIAFTLAQVIPTLADQQAVNVDAQTDTSTVDSSTAQPSPSASETTQEQSALETSDSDTTTVSAKPNPAVALSDQSMRVSLQSRVSVDPRAQIAKLPPIEISGPAFVLACIYTQNAIVDVISKGIVDDQQAQNLFLLGDLSSSLAISGQSELVASAIRSAGSARISSLGQRISTASLRIQVVAIDKMAQDATLCSQFAPANQRTVRFLPIGVDLGLKKGEVDLD